WTPLLFPTKYFFQNFGFRNAIRFLLGQFPGRKMNGRGDFSLLRLHAHEEISYSIDSIPPLIDVFAEGTFGIVIGWSHLDGEHFSQALFHDESVVDKFRYQRSNAFSIGAITAAAVFEISRNSRFRRKIRNFLKRDAAYRPVVGFGFDLREDLNQGEPG